MVSQKAIATCQTDMLRLRRRNAPFIFGAEASDRSEGGPVKKNFRQRPFNTRLLHSFCFLLVFLSPQALPDDAQFREANLRQLLQKNSITGLPVDSVRELVPLLPRELRENFTLVYDSRSPFRSGISADHPRVILFTKDGRFVLTFIGDERDPGSDLLESMSFDDENAKFELRSYLLPAADRKGWRPSPQAGNCARCHGADARPVFDAYPLWPGFYGAVLDTFPPDRIGAREEKRFKSFMDISSAKGVYQSLIAPAGSPVSPYRDHRRFEANQRELDPESLRFAPNARLGMALAELNRKRIYRKLAEGKDFPANEKSLLAELLDCPPRRPPSRSLIRQIDKQLAQENAEIRERLTLRRREAKDELYRMVERAYVHELAQIKSVAARAGSETSDWSMALRPNSLAFFDGILSGMYDGKSYYLKEDLIFEMLVHLSEREPAFRPYVAVYKAYDDIYPFGNRIELSKAAESCPLLMPAGSAEN
jgi:hypothetical protein